MTVESDVNKKLFNCDGVTPTVTFTFRVLENADLKVYLIDTTDPLAEAELKTEDVDYSLALEPGGLGGEITWIGAIPSSDFRGIAITEYALTQTADLPTEGNFNEESVEQALDRNCLLIIQLNEILERTLRAPVGDTATVFELPLASTRANALFAFDSLGNVTVVQLTELDQLAVSAFFATLASAANAAAALSLLGIPFVPASGSSASYLDFYEDTDNGTNYARLIGAAALAGNIILTLPNVAGTLLNDANTVTGILNKEIVDPSNDIGIATLVSGTLASGVGANVDPANIGTISSGTVTPAPQTHGPMPYYTNNGAHTLAPPANPCTLLVEITNAAGAGAITTSGFTKVDGDSFTTTNGHKFMCTVIKSKNYSALSVKALQ